MASAQRAKADVQIAALAAFVRKNTFDIKDVHMTSTFHPPMASASGSKMRMRSVDISSLLWLSNVMHAKGHSDPANPRPRQGVGEFGRPCLPWKQEIAGSNPAALTITTYTTT